eukprot:TRINITY_DN6009_c3_g1_i1.p1 TRINITY_DN6009_c3_g1~~TRINITY_DN6009_c3_g1_i1.p1  ORF type:complete len:253 (+),score=83.97 TRINITY_DN6009_c3_g1_i1:44-760(+)
MPVFKSFGEKRKEEPEEEEEEEEEVVDMVEEEEEDDENEELEMTVPKVPTDWAQRLQVTAVKELQKGEWNIDDDALREELFEKQALSNVEQAMHLLKSHGIPNKRPTDFYAEMVKSDVHMNKIRENMEFQRSKIKNQQVRRQQKHAAKFGKQVQTQVLQEREQQKADALAKIEHLKKKSKKFGMAAANDGDVDVAFGGDRDTHDSGPTSNNKRKRSLTPGARSGKKGGSKRPGKSKRR